MTLEGADCVPKGMGRGLRDFAIALGLSLLFMAAVYGASFFIPFAHIDDYYFWTYDSRETIAAHPQYAQYIEVGRYASALIWHFAARLVATVADLSIVRLLAALSLAVAMAQFIWLLRRLGHGWWLALVLPGLVFTLPGIGLNFVWILGFPTALCWPLSGAAYLLLRRGMMADAGARPVRYAMIAAAFAIVLFCLFAYPFAAVFFLVLYCADLLFSPVAAKPGAAAAVRVFAPGIGYAAASAAFYVIHSGIVVPALKIGKFKSEHMEFALVTDIAGRISYFFEPLTVRAFALWQMPWQISHAIAVASIILAGILVAALKAVRSGAAPYRMATAIGVAIGFAVFLSILPVLAAKSPHPGYRVIIGYSAIVVVVLVWALQTLLTWPRFQKAGRQVWLALLTVCLLLSGAHANGHIARDVTASMLEREAAKRMIKEWILSGNPLDHIHVVMPRGLTSKLGHRCTSFAEYHCTSVDNPFHLVWMLRSILLELGRDKSTIKVANVIDWQHYRRVDGMVQMTSSRWNEPVPSWSEPTLYIRYDQIFAPEPLPGFLENPGIMAAATGGGDGLHTADMLFDGSIRPNDFWEAGGGFPILLELLPKRARRLTGYSLYSGESSDRMPKSWAVWGMVPGNTTWRLLDERQNQPQWPLHSERVFEFAAPVEIQALKFEFRDGFDRGIVRIYELELKP
jgi:hypothetical protein